MRKSIDVVTQRMFGVAAIIFAVCFGISTITNNSLKADSPTVINNTGKIQMSESGFVVNGSPFYHILVWDSETGKSKLFWFNSTSRTIKATDYQLPTSPLY